MSNWKIEPTLFSTVAEIEEATDYGYLNYAQHDSNPDDNDFGYRGRNMGLPVMFWGGGENDRPNHQPMYVGDKYMFGKGSGRFEEYNQAVMWKDIREEYVHRLKPCPCCGNKDVALASGFEVARVYDEHTNPNNHDGVYVICSAATGNDGCGMTSGYSMDKHDAVITWNGWKRCR